VIAEHTNDELIELAQSTQTKLIKSKYSKDYLSGATLVIAATNDLDRSWALSVFKDNAGVQDTLKQIYDGVGGSSARGSALWISEDSVKVEGVLIAEAISVDLGFVINEVFIDDLHINDSLSSNASETDIGIDINPDVTSQVASSEYNALDIAVVGGSPSGTVVALSTHKDVSPIKQSVEVVTSPSQTEYAGEKVIGGQFWVDGIDASEIFAADDDEVYIGNTSGAGQFATIEVIMTTQGTSTVTPTFWYNTAADAWTQFYPYDGTFGFQRSGVIRWAVAGITAAWTNDGDPGGSNASTGYWIKIIRTADSDPGAPVPTTMKTGIATLYDWDSVGGIEIEHLKSTDDIEAVDNIKGATYGSDGSVSDAELLYINTLSSNAQTQITTKYANRSTCWWYRSRNFE
ncbi:hypothetical protein LCGC14_2089160, partial [marine sediment metagenome]